MKSASRFLVVLLLLASLPAAAQFGSVWKGIDKAKKVADASTPWTPEAEDAIGRAAAAKMIHIFGLYNNPAMTKYVNLVGNTVAQNSKRGVSYHFAILDTEILWACGMPGGYVFITRGALANMKNEAELAGVLAHEVAHVDGRHLERTIRDAKLKGIAVDEGTSHIPAPGVLTNMANELLKQALTQPYSPDKENEADKNGTEFSAGAGYDAAGLRNFLETLAQETQGDAARKQTGLWNGKSHPPFSERVQKLTEIAKRYHGGQTLEERFHKNASFETAAAGASTASK